MGRVDYYQLLGVDRGASTAEIKSAYRTKAKQTHPDVGGSADAFQLLQEAYETLADPDRRSAHDMREAMRSGVDPFRNLRPSRFRQSRGPAGAPPREDRRTAERTFRPRPADLEPDLDDLGDLEPEAAPADPIGTDPWRRSRPGRPFGQARTRSTDAGQPRTRSTDAGQARTRPAEPGPVRSRSTDAGPAQPRTADPGPAQSRTAASGPAQPRSTDPGPARPRTPEPDPARAAEPDPARSRTTRTPPPPADPPWSRASRVWGTDADTPAARPPGSTGDAGTRGDTESSWTSRIRGSGAGFPRASRTGAPGAEPRTSRSRRAEADPAAEPSTSRLRRPGMDTGAGVPRGARAREDPPTEEFILPEQPVAEQPRRVNLGEDPRFQPTLPQLDTRHIPWWRTVDLSQRVRYLPATGPGRTQMLAALGGCVLLALPVALRIGLGSPLFYVWLIALAAALALAAWLGRRISLAARADRRFAAELGGRTVFGRPGREPDQLAERLTAQLLSEYVMWLPGARIFHGLALPDSVFADVDHAVLCGRRLVLIESKLWLPGHYLADEDGELWRNDHPFRGGSVRLPECIAAYRRLLPDIEVRGALLLYPSRAGKITTGTPPDVAAPPMTPERFVREIGAWLAEEPAMVHRDAFRTVLDRLVTQTPSARAANMAAGPAEEG